MKNQIEDLNRLLQQQLPRCTVTVDAPDRPDGNWWLDVGLGKKRVTLEYRPDKGFGLFHGDAGYGEGPAEIYRSADLTAKRLAQVLTTSQGKRLQLDLKGIRELYGVSQVQLAKKVGIKQSAISRFESRDEVKLGTLEAAVNAIGGKLEVRAHFPDADVTIALSKSKR